jgi:hypothetical protein
MAPLRSNPLWLLLPLALVACESDSTANEPEPSPPSSGCEASSPGELARPPSGSLPCELFPPGSELGRAKQ